MTTKKLWTKILSFVLPLTLVPFVLTALAVYFVVIRAYTTQIEKEQNKLLAEAIVNMRREQEAARKDVALIANLPAVVEYLELASGEAPSATHGARVTSSLHAKEAAARATVQLFLSQNPYYLQLSLVDAQGRERLKFSKLPGSVVRNHSVHSVGEALCGLPRWTEPRLGGGGPRRVPPTGPVVPVLFLNRWRTTEAPFRSYF